MIDDLATLSSAKMSGRKTGSIGNLKARRFLQTRFEKIGLVRFSEHSAYIQTFPFPKSAAETAWLILQAADSIYEN